MGWIEEREEVFLLPFKRTIGCLKLSGKTKQTQRDDSHNPTLSTCLRHQSQEPQSLWASCNVTAEGW